MAKSEQLRNYAIYGLAEFAHEHSDLHMTLLQNIALGCLKLQQPALALLYALTAMRVRDRHGRVPLKAGYLAAQAAEQLSLYSCVPWLMSQVRARSSLCCLIKRVWLH